MSSNSLSLHWKCVKGNQCREAAAVVKTKAIFLPSCLCALMFTPHPIACSSLFSHVFFHSLSLSHTHTHTHTLHAQSSFLFTHLNASFLPQPRSSNLISVCLLRDSSLSLFICCYIFSILYFPFEFIVWCLAQLFFFALLGNTYSFMRWYSCFALLESHIVSHPQTFFISLYDLAFSAFFPSRFGEVLPWCDIVLIKASFSFTIRCISYCLISVS